MTCGSSLEHRTCDRCSLGAAGAIQVVPGHGNRDALVAYVAEAPGKEEDMKGIPLIGAAGKVIRGATVAAGMREEDIWYDNLVHCRPPNNDLRPWPDAVAKCPTYWLMPTLDELPNLKVIVSLGAKSGVLWFPGMKAHQMAKTCRALPGGKMVVGSFHPSYYLRSGKDERIWRALVASLRMAKELSEV